MILRTIVIAGAVIAAVVLTWAFIESHLLLVSRAVVSSPNVPTEFDGARIAFVADVHASDVLGRKRVKRVVDELNALDADLVILGGDYVGGRNGNGPTYFYPEAKRITAPLGVLAVWGNHDAWEDLSIADKGMRDAGITVIDNQTVRVMRGGSFIRVTGVEDLWTGKPDAVSAAEGVRAEDFTVLVSHNPDYFAQALPATKGAFDLALAGHTHGGQVTLFGLWAPMVPSQYGQRYVGGWLEEEGVPILVSRGVGVVTAPIRFCAPPEIHLIELRQGPAGVAH